MSTATLLEPTRLESALVPVNGQAAHTDTLFEMVHGQRVEKSPMGAYAVTIASILNQILGTFVHQRGMGRVVTEMLFILNATRNLRRRPDVAFVSVERWALDRPIPDEEDWDVIPNLAVEVVSKTNTAYEVRQKLGEYFQAGVQQVWVIYPRWQELHLYSALTQNRILTREDDLDGGSVIPGFRLPLATLFHPGPAPD